MLLHALGYSIYVSDTVFVGPGMSQSLSWLLASPTLGITMGVKKMIRTIILELAVGCVVKGIRGFTKSFSH